MITFGLGSYGGSYYGGGGPPAPPAVATQLTAKGYAATVAFDPVTNDVHFSSLKIAKGDDAIAQKLRQRFRFWLGEWFLDTRLGSPYRMFLGMKNPSIPAIQGILTEIILSVPQITTVQSMSIDWDKTNRAASVDFVALLDDGRTITAAAEPFLVV